MLMKYITHALLATLTILLLACGGEKAGETEEPAGPKKSGRSFQLKDIGLASPESVIGDGSFYYVSNVGKELKPSEKDGDGFIMKLDTAGTVVAEKFIEGLDAPKGSAIINGKFYVADIDKIRIFDMATQDSVGVIDLSSTGTLFLNDIVKKDDNAIFVSATDINRIFEVNLTDMTFERIETTPDVQKPNGLWYEAGENKLYTVTYPSDGKGKLSVITFDTKGNSFEALDPYTGSLDGIAIVGGNIFFSDWSRGAFLVKVASAGNVGAYFLPEGVQRIQGPADFYWDANMGEFWIPGMQENTLTIQTLR